MHSEYTQAFSVDSNGGSHNFDGLSGSPVYDERGQVKGVLSGAGGRPDSRHIFFEGLNHLQDLIKKTPKLNCRNFLKCIKEEEKRLKFHAENGDLVAQIQTFNIRKPTERNIKKAIDQLKPAAQKGHPFAQFNLALGYQFMGDYEQVFYWVEQLARQGYPSAQYTLREMYLLGKGVKQDITKATYWRKRAENQGR